MTAWRTRSRRVVLDLAPWLRVEEHAVELPDGRVIESWPWVQTRDYVNVVAVDGDGRFLVFEQTKYAVEGLALAPVGGYLEAGEQPLEAARRELLEEMGRVSDRCCRSAATSSTGTVVAAWGTSSSRPTRDRSESRTPTTSSSNGSSR